MATPESLRRIDGYWAAYFGCRPEDLRSPGTRVLPHAALMGYPGVLAFRRGPSCVVSIPEALPQRVVEEIARRSPDEVLDRDFLAGVFGNDVDTVTGPAWLGVADGDGYRPAPNPAVRLLDVDRHTAALRRLAEACGELAWRQSKVVFDRQPLYGYFEGEDVMAASAYEVLGGVLAYIGVVSHPAHRGRGYGRAVVTASMDHALGKGLLCQWRTLRSNAPAVALAQAMGFQEYAATVDVRLIESYFY